MSEINSNETNEDNSNETNEDNSNETNEDNSNETNENDSVNATNSNEDRYESIDMILKCRADGISWFDVLFDMITENCEGDPESEENTCTCGMESFGGMAGTLDQCYRQQGIADDLIGPVQKADLIRVLETFTPANEEDQKIYDRLYNECTWWDETLERWAKEALEEGEELVTFETTEEVIEWLKDDNEI